MKCSIFSHKTAPLMYIVVPAITPIKDLPADIQRDFDFKTPFKTLYIVEGAPRISLDPVEALANIRKDGFHIQEVTVLFEISANIC